MNTDETHDIHNKIDLLATKVDDIHKAIMGDHYDSDKGIMPRLKKVERYIESDKKVKWIGAGMAIALGTSLKSFWDWLTNHI